MRPNGPRRRAERPSLEGPSALSLNRMSWVRWGLAAAATLFAVDVAGVVATNQVRPVATPELALAVLVAWSFAVSGLVAWQMRPENTIGPAMIATSLLWTVSLLRLVQDPLLYTIGDMLEPGYIAPIMFVLLAFPTGRLDGTFVRTLAIVIFILTLPYQPAHLFIEGKTSQDCAGCPPLVIQFADAPAVGSFLHGFHHIAGALAGIAAVGVLVRRWRQATAALRFAIRPVLWTGTGMSVVLIAWVIEDAIVTPWKALVAASLELMLVAVAGSFLVGVARTRLARSAVADLMIELSGTLAPAALRAALARALHDPSLEIAYWLPEQRRFVDADGAGMTLPNDESRMVMMVERDGSRIAALIHDRAVDDEPLMRSVCAAAGLALENGRLQADLKSQLAEVRSSRARIVEAQESERRRIERDLHDGTQQRLVAIAMTLGLAEAKTASDTVAARELISESRSAMSTALEELRELSHGIHPGILTERGLSPAIDDLALRLRLPVRVDIALDGRLPTSVETTAYYVVSESLTNVAKYAHATAAQVRVVRQDGHALIDVIDDGAGGADLARGSGLRGLRDRVEALGGTFSVTSPPGRGTAIHAELPCA